jgi:glucose/arabinose dehydrogenase
MNRFVAGCLAVVFAASVAAAEPKVLVSGLKNPRAVAVGPDGRVYVTVCEDPEKTGTGAVMAIEDGKAVPFAKGLDAPGFITVWQNMIYVADKECVWRIDRTGKAERHVSLRDFPNDAKRFGGICVDERGLIYVATVHGGDKPDQAGWTAISRVDQRRNIRPVVDDPKRLAYYVSGIAMDGMSHLLLHARNVSRLKLADGSVENLPGDQSPPGQINGGFVPEHFLSGITGIGPSIGGVVWDHNGRLYWTGIRGNIWLINRPGDAAAEIATGYHHLGSPCLSPDTKSILVPDAKAGTISSIPTGDPKNPVDESPLPFGTEVAFPDLQWADWAGETPSGKPNALRPLVLTHANDKSNRNFVATQHGVIHVFPNDNAAKSTKVFLDIQSKVRYDDKQNEEGFLGLAFHPNYKTTGEFFVFYTTKEAGHHNVLSRFRVSKDDPDRADPASEEVLLRVQHKYWNHDGGTVVFGPDGYLYLALGDGGLGNDPDGNGQNLNVLLGKILRIDVNKRDLEHTYGIPPDNPFVGRADARPEVYAYGLRNVWRMAFDRQTKQFWAADVGQNLYEEIDLIEKGGNYGWGIREGLHPFGPKGVGPRPKLIDPIWEYDHEVGKSITGGAVYRGSKFPELAGMYLYADYVSGKIWALQHDGKRVTANRPIHDRRLPIMSFGEDEHGEMYLMTYALDGRGIYRLARESK